MKLIFAATYVSLIFQLVHCACLVYVIGKAQYNNGGLPSNGLTSQSSPWKEKNCCHLPEDEQDCSCCVDACILQRPRVLLPQNCCYLPKPLQTCQCCPRSCFPLSSSSFLQQNCCHLPKRFIRCRCCPAACLPHPVLPELSQLPQLSKPQLPFSCCHLPAPFRNCQCCPSACPLPLPVPLNESCCHWPKSLQNCVCCVSSCSSTTNIIDESVTEHAVDNCCTRVKPLPNCSCCAEWCDKGSKLEQTTEASTETTPIITTKVPKAPNNCCHFPIDLQNCNCCPSLCQETTVSTEQPTTPSPLNCCNQPEELQSCGCCPQACKRDEGKEISPSTVITITMTTSTTVPVAEKMGRCCHLSKKFRTCDCCPENCGATADLLQYGTCCHWPKLLQRCDCCRDACLYLTSSPQSTDLMEDCCDDPLELQDCQCCPTSRYCSLTISQRKMLQDLPYWYSETPSSDFLPYIDWYKENTFIAPRYKQREFEHRPETYFVHVPGRTKGSIIDYNNRRRLVSNEVFGYPYTKRRKYAEEYEHDDYNIKPLKWNPTVYDYYFSKPNYNKRTPRKYNKLADSILPSQTPFLKRRKNVAYRNFLKMLYPKRLGIDSRFSGDSLWDISDNQEGAATVDSVGTEDLDNLRSRTLTPNLKTISDALKSADSSINVRSKIPGMLGNLMLVGKKYRKKKTQSKKRIGKNWQFKAKLSLFRDNQLPYLSTSSLIPSVYVCPESPLNYVIPDDDQPSYRFSRYSPVHLAAPVETMKELITRISEGCDPTIISNSLLACQIINNDNKKQVNRIIPSLGLYNNGRFHNFGYLEDDDDIEDEDKDYYEDSDEDTKNDYLAEIGSAKVNTIPLEYSQKSFSSSSESQQYSFKPWNISNDKFSDKKYKTVPANDPTKHSSQENEPDSFWKVYSAPPKSLSHSNVLDGLSKIATGFEVNHGEIEFEPNEDYSDRLLRHLNRSPAQTNHVNKAADSLEGETKDPLRTLKEENIRDMAPWLDKYGVATLNYYIGKREPSLDLPISYTPSSNVRIIAIVDPDDILTQDETDVPRWYSVGDGESSQLTPAMLPVWNSWASDGTGSNLIDTNENDYYRDKIVGVIGSDVDGKDDSVFKAGLRVDQENFSGGEHNVEAQIRRPKRRIMVRKIEPLWLKLYKVLRLYNRKVDLNQFLVPPNRRDSFNYRDVPLEELFNSLKSLVPFQSLRRVQIVSNNLPIDRQLSVPLSTRYYKPKNKKKKKAKSLLRLIWPETSQVLDREAINELSLDSKVWPIAYGVDNAKSLEMSIPAPALPIRKSGKVVAFTHPSTKHKAKGTSTKGSKRLKNKQAHMMWLSHYGLSAREPIISYLQYINSPEYYRLFIEDDSLCQEERGTSNTGRRVVYPEITELVPAEGVNILDGLDPNDTPGDPEITYRLVRKFVEDGDDEFGNGDVGEDSLKPTIVYRISDKEEDDEKYDAGKIILKALASSRVARNSPKADQRQETVVGVEPPVVANLADVRNVQDQPRSLTETYTDNDEVSIPVDGNIGT